MSLAPTEIEFFGAIGSS
jgi:hypothetical protein